MDFGLAGAAICIIGGTKGMGRACAEGFAREGARVAISSRRQTDIDVTVETLRDLGAMDAFGVVCDITDGEQIDGLFAAIERRWGGLNTLINMAWPLYPAVGNDFSDLADATWESNAAALNGVVRACRAALPLLRQGGWGRIINISSVASRLGSSPSAAYMTAKAGLNALTKNMAWALAKEGILVNCVVPGVFLTPGMEGLMAAADPEEKAYRRGNLHDAARWISQNMRLRAVGAIGRVARPEEIVPLILLLGSQRNSFIVGAAVPIDGGTDWS